MTRHRTSEEIEDEIRHTRARIETRLEHLGRDLSPNGLLAKAICGTADDPSASLGRALDKARENPLSALMITIGLAGMVFGSGSQKQHTARVNDGSQTTGPTDPADRIAEGASDIKRRMQGARHDIADTAREAGEKLAEAASDLAGRFSDAAGIAAEKAAALGGAVDGLREQAGGHVRHASERGSEALKRAPVRARAGAELATDWIKENPVPSGLIALAVGAALASVFKAHKPKSRLEASRELHEEARSSDRSDPAAKVEEKSTPRKTKRQANPKSGSRKGRSTVAGDGPGRKMAARRGTGDHTNTNSKTYSAGIDNSESLARSTSVLGENPEGGRGSSHS